MKESCAKDPCMSQAMVVPSQAIRNDSVNGFDNSAHAQVCLCMPQTNADSADV